MDNATIVTRGLRRTFGEQVAVRSLDLDIPAGELYGLLGPNGSGKTTTVRILTTLLPATDGTAVVAGADVTRQAAAVRSSIGAVLQQTGLDPLMTANELIRIQAVLHGLSGQAATGRTRDLVDLLGLAECATKPVGRLSGGQRRRVDLAVALVHHPRVLFLDEPTTGLDPSSRRELWEEIARRKADGTTILLTTQYLEEAERMADRVGVLAGGELVAQAPPEELKRDLGERRLALGFRRPEDTARATDLLTCDGDAVDRGSDLQVRVRLSPGDERIVARLTALTDAGVPVASMSVEEPTLEDVFLRLAVAA